MLKQICKQPPLKLKSDFLQTVAPFFVKLLLRPQAQRPLPPPGGPRKASIGKYSIQSIRYNQIMNMSLI